MKSTLSKRSRTILVTGLFSFCIAAAGQTVPITWDEAALASMQTPLRDPSRTPKHISSATYDRIPALVFYKTYPVYAPGREPAGYLDMLSQQEPETVFDPARLHSPDDWAKAGEAVFDAPTAFADLALSPTGPQWYPAARVPIAKDGTYPFIRYVVRKKGKVELAENSCAGCHTRVMPDGTIVKGAQGNFPIGRVNAESLRAQIKQGKAAELIKGSLKPLMRQFFAAPWLSPDPYDLVAALSLEEIIARISQNPPGVMTRDGATFHSPPQIPDLIGIRDRRYLDHTGTKLHRSIADLMRYSALAQGAGAGSSWGDFRLVEDLPPFVKRYSDESLYALAMYLYSLQPPPNPNPFDKQAETGKAVFERAGCGGCHAAPLYTNNKLTPADGFEVPATGATVRDVVQVRVGTDPELAMLSRRGTGYYKVPSLKGVWYRGPFGHVGRSPTLEDWLDAARVKGSDSRKAVAGHEFGFQLTTRDKSALIAFLKTL